MRDWTHKRTLKAAHWAGCTFTKNMKRHIVRTQMQADEYASFLKGFSRTLYKKKSHYARKLLLGEPVTVIYRNHSLDDFIEMAVGLMKELRLFASMETLSVSEKETLEQKVLSIQKHLIQVIDSCSHTS